MAGLRRAVAEGVVPRRASALVVITGSGLKDIRSAATAVRGPYDVTPDPAALEALIAERRLNR